MNNTVFMNDECSSCGRGDLVFYYIYMISKRYIFIVVGIYSLLLYEHNLVSPLYIFLDAYGILEISPVVVFNSCDRTSFLAMKTSSPFLSKQYAMGIETPVSP